MVRILVIDDDRSLRENIAEILELTGYDTLKAENGAMGIQMAQESLPDMIVCDVMMPGLNGYDVVQRLQSEARTAAIPFLFLTAKADHASRRQGMGLGADDYLTKPFAPDDLLAAVQTRLEKRALMMQTYEQRFDELRGNLVSVLPHELRTPLNIIMGYTELILMDDQTLDQDTVRMVETIARASKRLRHVIENYLLYAQTEIQRSDRQAAEAFSNQRYETPGTLIQDIASQTAITFDRAADMTIEAEDIPIRMTGELLRKLLEEIIDNAFKFSKAGSPVNITAERHEDRYSIRVSDQGRGMSAEHLDRVGAYMQFERKLYEQQGLGLGLILARRFAELHGGTLTIESELGQGTVVNVTVPLAS